MCDLCFHRLILTRVENILKGAMAEADTKLVSGCGGRGRGWAGRGPTGPARGGAWCAARPDPAPSQTSHAITLQKTVEYITKLQQERSQMQEEARRLREEIEELNATIL